MKPTQVIVIHGGSPFRTQDEYLDYLKNLELTMARLKKVSWKDFLGERLGEKFDVIKPEMPCKMNPHYDEWKIYFEKVLAICDHDLILVGHSLGGIFLAKFLSENKTDKNILASFLVAAPSVDVLSEETLGDFLLQEDLSLFEKQSSKITLFHSTDDPVVSIDHLEKYRKQLPNAKFILLNDRKHFSGDDLPEIVGEIQNILS